jgi:adenylyltransferase/sulfurtransferase
LTSQEKERYYRHIILPEIGKDGQEKLLKAKVLVVGVGGLGAVSSLYLANSGIGSIGLVDHDKVELSNLPRQILYGSNDIGRLKVEVARHVILSKNPDINIKVFPCLLDEGNALDIIKEYDIIVSATDNSAARYLINDTCVKLNKPFVHGSLSGFEGQLAVFNYINGKSYRDVFPEPPAQDFRTEHEKGVITTLPGIIGIMQANEVIKMIIASGEILKDKLLIYNALNNHIRILD